MATNLRTFFRQNYRWTLALFGLAVLITAWSLFQTTETTELGAVFKARRGNFSIKILEGGSIEATDSQEIRSEFRSHEGTKILKIVEEGYIVTEEDVTNGKVLVEMDSAAIQERIINQDIQYQASLAALIDAQQDFDIQFNQSTADIKLAKQKVRFARMDLEKYLGVKVAAEVIAQQKLYEDTNEISLPDVEQYLAQVASQTNMTSDTNLAAQATAVKIGELPLSEVPNQKNALSKSGVPEADDPLKNTIGTLLSDTRQIMTVDFAKYAEVELLGDGSAKQMIRKLGDDVQMLKAQQKVVETKLMGTRRLYEKKFVPKTDLDSDQLTYDNNDLKIKTAETALDLYMKYEFPKTSEEYLSRYEECLRLLTQTRRAAIAKLAQVHARFKSSSGRFKIDSERRQDLYDQLGKCIIRAEKAGLVVYGTDGHMFGGEQIREGATIRERQKILTIPDMNQMAVKIKIHETFIKKVESGQPSIVKVDAYPDEPLSGEVAKVAMLPDYQNRWLNPDVKVYVTMININEAKSWLKPGMSAKVEILVKQLTNVVYIPLQCVSFNRGQHTCYVNIQGAAERRVIGIGDFNDEFIEVKSGLNEGEEVFLNRPEGMEAEVETSVTDSASSQTNEAAAFVKKSKPAGASSRSGSVSSGERPPKESRINPLMPDQEGSRPPKQSGSKPASREGGDRSRQERGGGSSNKPSRNSS